MSIISISGRKQVGKDTVAHMIQYITDYYQPEGNYEVFKKSYFPGANYDFKTWEIRKFANKLKDIVCILLNCTKEELENESFKNKQLEEEWSKIKIVFFHNQDVWTKYYSYIKNKEWLEDDYDLSNIFEYSVASIQVMHFTPRILLQQIGTDCFRNIIHPDTWVISTMGEYNNEHNWIITDTRFPNELRAVKNKKAITIKINRNTGLSDTHESETALDNASFDWTIDNNSSFDDLFEQLFTILKNEKII
jgi:hypothetical protein